MIPQQQRHFQSYGPYRQYTPRPYLMRPPAPVWQQQNGHFTQQQLQIRPNNGWHNCHHQQKQPNNEWHLSKEKSALEGKVKNLEVENERLKNEIEKLRAELVEKEEYWEEEKDTLQIIMMERDDRDILMQEIAKMKKEKDVIDKQLALGDVKMTNMLIQMEKMENELAKYKSGMQ